MPEIPGHACAGPGCPEVVKYGDGELCWECAKKRYRWRDSRRPSSAKRGYGSQWQRVRLAHLAGEPLCRFCRRRGEVTAANEVDHIDGDSSNNDPSNLRSLCKSCHSRRTLRDQVPRRRR